MARKLGTLREEGQVGVGGRLTDALPACPPAVQYAQWEEGQKDFRRARSVWERALEVSYTAPATWLKYAEMEMRHRFINHARNVWDRAVSLLPRVDQLWCARAGLLLVHNPNSDRDQLPAFLLDKWGPAPAPARSCDAGWCPCQLAMCTAHG